MSWQLVAALLAAAYALAAWTAWAVVRIGTRPDDAASRELEEILDAARPTDEPEETP